MRRLPTSEVTQRRRLLGAAAALCAAPALRAAPALPAVNLWVELRLADALDVQRDAAVSGGVVIDSRGNVRGAAQVSPLGSTQRQAQSAQSVRVLNGGQARLQMVQTQPLLGAVAAWSGTRGVAAPVLNLRERDRGGAVVTTWAELVDGFEVRPRWPGGSEPVMLDIGAMRSLGPAQGNAPPPQFNLFTTVQVVLGEWTDVAEVRQAGSATVTTGAGTTGIQRALRMQVRAAVA
jgi:hypothetical protein